MRIGYLEDDQQLAALTKEWLESAGHAVYWTDKHKDFIQHVKQGDFDMLVLDWELPDITGIEVLEHIRKILRFELPVLFCTQRDSESDVVTALEQGADDYLVKPVREFELKARIAALARRAGLEKELKDVLEVGPYVFDLKLREAFKNGEKIALTEKDFEVAVCLYSNIGRVLSRAYLLETIWGLSADLNTRTVDVHVSRVRKALGITSESGYRIKTVYQHGYRLETIAPAD